MLTAVLLYLAMPAYTQQQVSIQVYYDAFGQECSWEIVNKINNTIVLSGSPGASNSFNYNQTFPFYPGEYEFRAFDSNDDGWEQGGWYQVSPGSGIGTGQVFFTDGSVQSTSFSVYSSNPVEIGVVSWISPVSGPGLLNNQSVTVQVRNYGTSPISNFTLSYSINGGFTHVTETFFGTLPSGQTLSYTFLQTANMQNTGSYSCLLNVSATGDVYASNNSLTTTIMHIATVSSFPWTENFNSFPPSLWTLSGNNDWAAYGGNAAYANLSSWLNANASLMTPPINLAQATTLNFKWSSFFTEFALNDKLSVQISTNNGSSWSTLWEKSGVELFSNDGSNSTTPGSYQTASIDLSSFINTLAYIRFVASNTSYSCSIFLDYVNISPNSNHDLELTEILYPEENGCNLSTSEYVQVRVKNKGTVSVPAYSLTLTLNGSAVVTNQITNPLGAGQIYTHLFTSNVNLSLPGNYTLNAQVNYSSDPINANNTQTLNINNTRSINSFPFTENFQNNASDYFTLSTNQYSSASIVNQGNDYMVKMEGGIQNLNPVWVGSSISTTAQQAWEVNTHHLTTLTSCLVDASSLSSCELFFDLKQFYRQGANYSWFRVSINGQAIADVNNQINFNPITESSDPFARIHYDLSTYAGTSFILEFQSANKYNSSLFPGNVTFIDSILIREIPEPDVDLIAVLSPVSSCNWTNSELVSVQLINRGGTQMGNFQISYKLDDGNLVSELFSSTIEPEDTVDFTFSTPIDLSAYNGGNLNVNINPANDQVTSNNTRNHSLQPIAPQNLSVSGLNSTYCFYEQAVILNGTPVGGSFSGPGVSGSSFNPQDAGNGTHQITYTYSDPANNCISTLNTPVTVIGDLVSFSGFPTGPSSIAVIVQVYYNSLTVNQHSWEIKDQQGNVVLPTGSGGIYNGWSYNDTMWLSPGVYTFFAYDSNGDGWNNSYYKITPLSGIGTGLQLFQVPAGQTVYSQSHNFTVGQNPQFCGSDLPVQLTGSPAGGTFSGPGIIGDLFYPGNAGTGNHPITYTYSISGCTGSSSREISVLPSSNANLGNDLILCDQSSASLALINPGSGNTYLWSNGATTASTQVSTSGTYLVTLTSSNGCKDYDTVQVSFNSSPQFTLGSDIDACVGETIILTSSLSGDQYLWNTGATSSSLEVSSAGTYSLQLTLNGCTAQDIITVSFNSPQTQLPTSYSFCAGQTGSLSAGQGFSSYLWSGGQTTSSIAVQSAGLYSVTVSDANSCTGSASSSVMIYPLPTVNLGSDQVINELHIVNIGGGYSSILWSDGQTSPIHAFDPLILGIGSHTFWVQVTNAQGCLNRDTIVFTVNQINASQSINLPVGWSIFSLNIIPNNTNIANILQPVLNDLIIVKDGSGAVYWPSNNVNSINQIETGEGFQIFMSDQSALTVNGVMVQPENTPISLGATWSILGYLRTSPASASVLLNPIIQNITIVKDGNGSVYWPSFGFNGIGNFNPGQGYLIKLSTPTVLTYPANSSSLMKESEKLLSPGIFKLKYNSDQSMTIGIPAKAWDVQPPMNSEIGIFNSENQLVGSGIWNGSFAAITLWGVSSLIPGMGLSLKEAYHIKTISSLNGSEQEYQITAMENGDGLYAPNDIEIIRKIKQSSAVKSGNVFPNPVNNQLYLEYYSENNDPLLLEILDSRSSLVKKITIQEVQSGKNLFSFDSVELSQGNYFLKVTQNRKTDIFNFIKSN